MGVGMPADLWLNEFGSQVWSAFGEPPYHVGSSLANKDGWRDVDVRVMLDDDAWARWGFSLDQHTVDAHMDPKWVAVCLAFSALGKQMTGLPIDFQIQRVDDANAKFPGPRSAIGIVSLRCADPKDVERRSNMVTINDLAKARLHPANAPADEHTLSDLGEIARLSEET